MIVRLGIRTTSEHTHPLIRESSGVAGMWTESDVWLTFTDATSSRVPAAASTAADHESWQKREEICHE